MLNRIFPRQIDNTYRGHRLAIWFLVPIVLMKTIIGANSAFNAHDVATTADGIALDSYGAAGAHMVLALFALLGFCLLLLALQGIVVLVRYRAMIPAIYLLLLVEQLGSKALLLMYPTERSGATTVGALSVGSIINYSLLAMLLAGFVLSLWRGSPPTASRS